MKKVLVIFKMLTLLTSVVLILGCGSGGSGSSASRTPENNQTTEWQPTLGVAPDEPIAPGTGQLVIDFTGEQAEAGLITAQAGLITAQALALSPNWGRAIISKYGEKIEVDEWGEEYIVNTRLYYNVLDVPIGEKGYMRCPAGTDYQIDILTHAFVDPLHVGIKYGQKTGVVVNQGVTNSVTITLNPITAELNVPAQIEDGLAYDLRKNNPWPIRNDISHVRHSFEPIPADTILSGTAYPTDAFIAPSPIVSTVNLYLQGVFYIDNGLLTDTENKQWYNWTYVNSQTTQITPITTLEIIIN